MGEKERENGKKKIEKIRDEREKEKSEKKE